MARNGRLNFAKIAPGPYMAWLRDMADFLVLIVHLTKNKRKKKGQ
jgi:hypothetical protein